VDLIIISNTRLAMEFTTSLLPIANTKKIPVFSYASEPVKQGVLAGMGVDEAKLGAMLAQSVVDVLEVVAKPHKHFFNVTMTHASWKKATNILI
jgi:ABC-type uncharacterized transport system substrate-binding protein